MSTIKVALTYNLKPKSFEEFFQKYNSSISEEDFKSEDQFAEWDNIEVIEAVKEAITKKYNCVLIEADINFIESIKLEKPNIVFNISEGLNQTSREAQVPAILDMLNIPYTGSGVWTLATCLDKFRTKQILEWNNIKTPKAELIHSLEDVNKVKNNLQFPIILKPISEGSSKGIFNDSLINSFEEGRNVIIERLNKYKQPFLAEEFLSGREFTVGILGNYPNEEVLPIVEIKYDIMPADINKIYSYEAKWIIDRPENPLDIFECPAKINQKLKSKIIECSLRAYRSLDCKDWARIDIRLDNNDEPNILEINPLPGILPKPEDNSCLPKAARAAGYSYEDLILKILENGMMRYNLL